MFVYMGAHDDTWDFTVMQITLEAALKTKFKEQVEAATVKECLNIINFKTFKYLRSKEHAEKSPPLQHGFQGQARLKGRAIAMEEPILHRRSSH